MSSNIQLSTNSVGSCIAMTLAVEMCKNSKFCFIYKTKKNTSVLGLFCPIIQSVIHISSEDMLIAKGRICVEQQLQGLNNKIVKHKTL